MWESRLSGSERGWATTRARGEIVWHRRETRRQTEKTNLTLQLGERPIYSKPCLPRYARCAVREIGGDSTAGEEMTGGAPIDGVSG